MSANADVLQTSERAGSGPQQTVPPLVGVFRENGEWKPQNFAREQIRGLVRRVFCASGLGSVRQVVFSAASPNTDAANICDLVGQVLALETRADVAIVGREHRAGNTAQGPFRHVPSAGIKSRSFQTAINVWRVPRWFGPKVQLRISMAST